MMISDGIAQPRIKQWRGSLRGATKYFSIGHSHIARLHVGSGQAREPHICPDSVRPGVRTFSVNPELG